MNPWLDGLTVLANEWQITAAILLCAAGSQALTGIFLSLIFASISALPLSNVSPSA
jgi:hypothetical protein